ncbi:MAG: hypothetical protein AAF405_09245 [Pseudomonadota bacterium]
MDGKTSWWRLAIMAVICTAFSLSAGDALAKKKAQKEPSAVQTQGKAANAKNCRRGPVPPFMRNPRFMNRGFLKKKCAS